MSIWTMWYEWPQYDWSGPTLNTAETKLGPYGANGMFVQGVFFQKYVVGYVHDNKPEWMFEKDETLFAWQSHDRNYIK